MLGMGTVGVPNLIVYNPNAIESWDMRPSTGGSSFHFNSLERNYPVQVDTSLSRFAETGVRSNLRDLPQVTLGQDSLSDSS